MEYLILEFLNTDWIKRHKDGYEPLNDEKWLSDYFYKIFGVNLKLTDQMPDKLLELRKSMIAFLEDQVENKLDEDKLLKYINEAIKKVSGSRVIASTDDGYKMKFNYRFYDLEAIIAELSLLMFELIFNTDSSRIRICENPDCRYIFYDTSKNKSKRHCYEGCANLMKVRRFRAKSKS